MIITFKVIMASYNRRSLTLSVLSQLRKLETSTIRINVTVCDDGSTDGTGDAIRLAFPEVQVIETPGELFWAKSMNIADVATAQENYDFLVWLNDDTSLMDDAFERVLLEYEKLQVANCILVGALRDPITKMRTYSGCTHDEVDGKIHLDFISPKGFPVALGMFSGNFVVIPKEVRRLVGPISSKFRHGWADMEYGYRAKHKGVKTYLMSDYVGYSEINPLYSFHLNPKNSRWSRIRHVLSKKSYHPIDYLRFCLIAFRFRGVRIYFSNMWRMVTHAFNGSAG